MQIFLITRQPRHIALLLNTSAGWHIIESVHPRELHVWRNLPVNRSRQDFEIQGMRWALYAEYAAGSGWTTGSIQRAMQEQLSFVDPASVRDPSACAVQMALTTLGLPPLRDQYALLPRAQPVKLTIHEGERYRVLQMSASATTARSPPSESSHSLISENSSEFVFPLDDGRELKVYTYRPSDCRVKRFIFVIHGMLREAEKQRDMAVRMANTHQFLVIVPWFDKEQFPNEDFQRGGIVHQGKPQPREKWTFMILAKLAAEVRKRERNPSMPYWLFGHSAGGQFCNRLAAFHPQGPRRIVASNPGSLLFPDMARPFPYGFGKLPRDLSNEAMLRQYLGAPLTLYLGDQDTDPHDEQLDCSNEAEKEGGTRFERGLNCFYTAQQVAGQLGCAFNWELVVVPGVGHQPARMLNSDLFAQAAQL